MSDVSTLIDLSSLRAQAWHSMSLPCRRRRAHLLTHRASSCAIHTGEKSDITERLEAAPRDRQSSYFSPQGHGGQYTPAGKARLCLFLVEREKSVQLRTNAGPLGITAEWCRPPSRRRARGEQACRGHRFQHQSSRIGGVPTTASTGSAPLERAALTLNHGLTTTGCPTPNASTGDAPV